MPPRNICPIEVFAITPYRTMVIDGGTSGPIIDDAAVTEPEKSSSYPALRMASISILPSPAASASAEPDIPEKNRLARMLTCPSPPRTWPTSARAKPNRRLVMPAPFRIAAARMNSGTASIGKLFSPSTMRETANRSPIPDQ